MRQGSDPAPAAGKLVELDTLRGLMALWVYFSHVHFITGGPETGPLGLIGRGGEAVTVFMMLSGFAIATSLLNSRATYGQFMMRRFARIYPIYLVGLALGVATSQLYAPLLAATGWADPQDVTRIAERSAGEVAHFWPHLLAHLTQLHGAIPDALLYGSSLTFNGPAWSLSLEMQFYLVAPLMVAVLAKPERRLLALGVLLALAVVGPHLGRWWPQVPSFLPQRIGLFIIGILTAVHLPALARRPGQVLAAAAAVVCVAAALPVEQLAEPMLIWCGVLVAAAVGGHPILAAARRILTVRFLVARGEESYGFYILHMPILLAWASFLHARGVSQDRAVFAAALLASLPVTAVLASASYRWFESPINAWAKARFRGVRLREVDSVAGG